MSPRGSYVEMRKPQLLKIIKLNRDRLATAREDLVFEEVALREKSFWNRIQVWNKTTHNDIEDQVRSELVLGAPPAGLSSMPSAFQWQYRWFRVDANRILNELENACEYASKVCVSTSDLYEINR